MDWQEIGQWASDKGAYVAIIGIQARIIIVLLRQFFIQQEILTDALRLGGRAVERVEKTERP